MLYRHDLFYISYYRQSYEALRGLAILEHIVFDHQQKASCFGKVYFTLSDKMKDYMLLFNRAKKFILEVVNNLNVVIPLLRDIDCSMLEWGLPYVKAKYVTFPRRCFLDRFGSGNFTWIFRNPKSDEYLIARIKSVEWFERGIESFAFPSMMKVMKYRGLPHEYHYIFGFDENEESVEESDSDSY